MPSETRITSLKPEKLAALLKAAGSRHATAETIRADIDAGAPVNPDGTVSLVEYGAWLAKETEADHGD